MSSTGQITPQVERIPSNELFVLLPPRKRNFGADKLIEDNIKKGWALAEPG